MTWFEQIRWIKLLADIRWWLATVTVEWVYCIKYKLTERIVMCWCSEYCRIGPTNAPKEQGTWREHSRMKCRVRFRRHWLFTTHYIYLLWMQYGTLVVVKGTLKDCYVNGLFPTLLFGSDGRNWIVVAFAVRSSIWARRCRRKWVITVSGDTVISVVVILTFKIRFSLSSANLCSYGFNALSARSLQLTGEINHHDCAKVFFKCSINS